MFQLNELASAGKKKKRVGRGGSRGGTSGAGHKGQKARSGHKIRPGFEGGQMVLYRRLPKHGFNNTQFNQEVKIISIGKLNDLFDDGVTVTKQMLVEQGALKLKKRATPHYQYKLKILGNGALTKKLEVHADAFSKSAQEAIEAVGGAVHISKES